MNMYFTTFGQDGPDPLSDSLDDAITWLMLTIRDLEASRHLPSWRAKALHQQAENMPRAGTAFTVPGVGLIKVERR